MNDDIIKQGFNEILAEIKKNQDKKEELSEDVKKNRVKLLIEMGALATPLVADHGINLLVKSRSNSQGEVLGQEYSDEKMFVLGRCEPLQYRPDDPSKSVDNQFCVLTESGKFCEIMYTSLPNALESYINTMSPDDAVEIYGTEIIFMIYKAFEQYLKEEDELIAALEKTVAFVFSPEKK